MKSLKGAVCALLLLTQLHGPAAAAPMEQAATTKTDVFYVVAAHPDDEPNIWSLINSLDPSTYVVFIDLTRGEGTVSCLRREDAKDEPHATEKVVAGEVELELTFVEGFEATGSQPATGPYKYQGPNSPVDEDDKGEKHPYGSPWTGQGSEECKRARIASWHWFMDAMHHLDGSGTSFEIGDDPWLDDDYRLECPPGVQGNGHGRPVEKEIGCADVWADENGARISFDLGNTNAIPQADGSWGFGEPLFGTEEVIAAIETVRDSREDWGIPNLPERGIATASGHYDGDDCGPATDKNPDHRLVQDVFLNHDFGAGPQYIGMVCPHDRLGEHPTVAHVLPPDQLVQMQIVDPVTEDRIGPFNKYYGWLFSTYMYFKSTETYTKVFD